MSTTDRAATRERHFKDPKSRVMRDGRESLRGKDWDQRKFELLKRSGGRCEFFSPEGRCAAPAEVPSHIEPRHPLRDDRLSNLKAQCGYHDRLTEKQSWRKTRFGEKHEQVDT